MDPDTMPFDEARRVFARTRPWMRFLGVVSIITAAGGGIVLAAGVVGLGANPPRAIAMIAGGGAFTAVCVLFAVFQLGYADALAKVGSADADALPQAIERACTRQRNLWIATGVVTSLSALVALFKFIAVLA